MYCTAELIRMVSSGSQKEVKTISIAGWCVGVSYTVTLVSTVYCASVFMYSGWSLLLTILSWRVKTLLWLQALKLKSQLDSLGPHSQLRHHCRLEWRDHTDLCGVHLFTLSGLGLRKGVPCTWGCFHLCIFPPFCPYFLPSPPQMLPHNMSDAIVRSTECVSFSSKQIPWTLDYTLFPLHNTVLFLRTKYPQCPSLIAFWIQRLVLPWAPAHHRDPHPSIPPIPKLQF